MQSKKFQYKSKDLDPIIPREFNFDFPEDLDPVWIPNQPERSHFFNGMSIVLPYLEPFLMRTMREAQASVDAGEKALIIDMKHFIQQEGHHYRCHRRFNDLLKSKGFSELDEVEQDLADDYKKMAEKSLRYKLAYSAGFESTTCGFTTWLILKRKELFFGASPELTSFWLMHMIEEVEHKTVAFDAYMAHSGDYWPRIYGLLYGSWHVYATGIRGMFKFLRKDGLLFKPDSILRSAKVILSAIAYIGPFVMRAMHPRFDPRDEQDPQWALDWLKGHARLSANEPLPLIDTNDPNLPTPFTSVS